MARKPSKGLNALLAVIALTLVVGGAGLFWVAWRGVQMLRQEASNTTSVLGGDASALAGNPDYVGTWTGGDQTLTIAPTGNVDWTKTAGARQSLHGSLSVDHDELVINVFVTTKRMHVDAPPHHDQARMVMTLDGVEFERK